MSYLISDHMIHVQADFLQITFAIQMNIMNEQKYYRYLIGIEVTLVVTYPILERT